MDSGGYAKRSINENEVYNGGGHGLAFIFWLLEANAPKALVCGSAAAVITWAAGGSFFFFLAMCMLVPMVMLVGFGVSLVLDSIRDSSYSGTIDWTPYIDVKDTALARSYAGKKIPMETMVEAYMHEKIDFKMDPLQVLWQRNDLFRFNITLGHLKYFVAKFVGQLVVHSQRADSAEVRDVYDRGNDFYNWFLGPTMIYTSGVYTSENDTLEEAQKRKLDTVCQKLQMKKGDRHLDIGCGWGTLLCHAAKFYGTTSTGVTLAKEQKKWGLDQAEEYGVSKNVNVLCMDYRDIPEEQKFDKITCLEMAEHVGIKNFQTFLRQVKSMLTEDGLFYLQIAGLRRAWQYEDLIWGLFMGTYIFPAADASCPLGFVVSQLERAGFEVHSVENTGVHYGLTINCWYNNWVKNRKKVVAKYGEWWYRLWIIFLGWSTIVASQGSSTVFMITCHKNKSCFDRKGHWVGKKAIATQQ